MPVKERKDECQMLRVTYFGGKKRKEKEIHFGLAFTALPAQVSIRLASELALKIPKFPQSELTATITHSYGASDGRRQNNKAVVLVPFPAQKAKVVSWDTMANPRQCQPEAAGEGRARGSVGQVNVFQPWLMAFQNTVKSHGFLYPQNYNTHTVPRPQWGPEPSDAVYCWHRNVSRGSGTQSGPIRTTAAPCFPWGSRHRTAPSAPAQLPAPRCPAPLPSCERAASPAPPPHHRDSIVRLNASG